MHARAVHYLLPVLALLPGLTLVSSCKTRGFQTSSINRPTDSGAFERWLKAQDSLVPVQETVQRAGTSTEDGQAYSNARKAFAPKRPFESKAGVRDIRPELVGLSATDGLRDLLESSIIAEQRRRSALLKEGIFASSSPQRYDTIIIGSGPHAAALVQEFTDLEPNRSVLVIDAASRPGGTFAEVGPVFALNSTNREDTGEQANVGRGQSGGEKGDGNLNAIADLIGIPDLSGLKWPLAGDLGYVTTLAVEYSAARVLLNTRVKAVGSRSQNTAFVRLEDEAEARRTVEVEANQVILATGIGKPSFFLPRKEQDRLRLAASASETQPPTIMLFGEFIRRVNEDLRNKRNPMQPYANKRILVVGAGDSGKVVLEWLAGLGPDSRSYGPAQIGEPKKIVWAGVDFLTCQEFLNGARARYSRIAQPLNSSLIALAPVRIKNFSAPTDGKSVTITDFDLQDKKSAGGSRDPLLSAANLSDSDRAQIERLASNKTFFTTRGIKTGDLKTKDQTAPDGSLQLQIDSLPGNTFDYLIDATGFRTETLALLQNGFSKELIPDGTPLSQLFEGRSRVFQEGANQQNRGKNRRFVAQLKDPSSSLTSLPIFVVGPANEQIAALVDGDETANVSANTVSLFANIIRTKQLPRELVKASPGSNPVALDLSRGTLRSERPLLKVASGTPVNSEINLSLKPAPAGEGSYKVVPTKEDLEVGVRKIISSLNVQGATDDFQLWIFLDQRQQRASRDQRTITVKVTPGFQDEEDRNVLLAAINGDRAFQDLLFKSFPPDVLNPVAAGGDASFAESSKKIVLIDDWNGSSDGSSEASPLVALRLRADATASELKKATGIDLTQVNTPTTGASARKDQTLLGRIARGEARALCLVFSPIGDGRQVRAINNRTRENGLGSGNRSVFLQQARGTRGIEANLDTSAYVPDYSTQLVDLVYGNPLMLDDAIVRTRELFLSGIPNRSLQYPNKNISPYAGYPLSIPFQTAEGTFDIGIQLRNYLEPTFDFPFGQELGPTGNIPTIAPTDRPDVLSFNISDERKSGNYLLICSDTFAEAR